jgi:uncharacterized membrane protein YeiH
MLLNVAEYIGIIAFSASGYYIGRRNGLDWLGIYIGAFLTALGGGIVRDILIDRPPLSLTHSAPIYLVFGITTALLLMHRYREHNFESKPLFVFVDAIGMNSFALSGALATLETTDFNLAGVTAMAFTTAIGGGIARDILINKLPYVLHSGFYGIIAVGLGLGVYTLHTLTWLNTFTLVVLFFIGVSLRMIAYTRNWHLPKG